MKRIIIASNNKSKIEEIKKIFGGSNYQFATLEDVGFECEITEDQNSFEGNALKKAVKVMESVKELTLADDSGLEVDILDGQPGVFSARFAGQAATDKKNNTKLLGILNGLPEEKRGAQFRCIMVLAYPDGTAYTAEGICRGKITNKPRGDSGFGYDPIFIPDGFNKTFAELGESVKNSISHRRIALLKIKEIIAEKVLER